jgi:hypothetical protein
LSEKYSFKFHVVTIGPKIKAQNKIDSHAAGYNRRNLFHRKFFHEVLFRKLSETNNPLMKKKLGRPSALSFRTDINEPSRFSAELLNECCFTTIKAAMSLMSVKLL